MGIRIQGSGIDVKVGIMSVPYRKNKILYMMNNNELEILAYFKSDEKSQKLDGVLELILKAVNGGQT